MRIPIAAAAASLVIGPVACRPPATLSDRDRAALHRLDSAYVQAWLRDDTAAVLATLAPDAVLMPAGGRPVRGDSAIRALWWPRDGSRTRITAYEASVDDIGGTPTVAYMRGRGTLTFTYTKDTVRLRQTTRNMTLTVATKQSDGTWRISRRMWGSLSP